MDAEPAALCLIGPTASGKTELAVELVARLPFEIVSVDSVMIYRGMDIGSAKPDAAVLARAPHRLIDIRDPAESYSAADFARDAGAAMAEIRGRGRIPLLVGGTLLYFRALQQGLSPLPAGDPALRRELRDDCVRRGSAALHARLAALDPDTAARVHPHDAQRILRALEVHRLTGRPLSELQRQRQRSCATAADWHHVVLLPADTERVRRQIERRFERMLETGLIAEVEALYRRGDLDLNRPALRAVGYRQVWQYLDGRFDRAEMRNRAVVATRQFAKRQRTWLRHQRLGLGGGRERLTFDSQRPDLYDSVIKALPKKLFAVNGCSV